MKHFKPYWKVYAKIWDNRSEKRSNLNLSAKIIERVQKNGKTIPVATIFINIVFNTVNHLLYFHQDTQFHKDDGSSHWVFGKYLTCNWWLQGFKLHKGGIPLPILREFAKLIAEEIGVSTKGWKKWDTEKLTGIFRATINPVLLNVLEFRCNRVTRPHIRAKIRYEASTEQEAVALLNRDFQLYMKHQ